MTENNTKSFYTSPLMKVMEIKARQMLCQSPSTEKYDTGLWNN